MSCNALDYPSTLTLPEQDRFTPIEMATPISLRKDSHANVFSYDAEHSSSEDSIASESSVSTAYTIRTVNSVKSRLNYFPWPKSRIKAEISKRAQEVQSGIDGGDEMVRCHLSA